MTAALAAPARTPLRGRPATAATFVVHGLLFSSWTAHIPAIQHHLHLTDGGLGLVLLGAPIGSIASIALTGPLLPRIGSRRAVQLALVPNCLAGLLVGVVGAAPHLFLALMLWGFGQGALDVSMNTQAVFVERAGRRPVMPGLHAGWGIGAFTGAGVGAAAVALGIGLLPQLAVLGPVALVVTWVMSQRMLPDAAHEAEPRGRLQLEPVLLLLALAAFGSMLCEGSAADWSAVYLRGTLHASPGIGGLGYTVFALALVGARLSGNRLLRRHVAATVVPTGALAAALGFGLGLLSGDVAGAMLGLGLLGLGLGLVVPSCLAAAGRLGHLHPGRSVATVSGLGWVGFVVGPPLIGALAGASTLRSALLVVPVLALLAAASSLKGLHA